jgi:hypothetical protein
MIALRARMRVWIVEDKTARVMQMEREIAERRLEFALLVGPENHLVVVDALATGISRHRHLPIAEPMDQGVRLRRGTVG